ncbi:MAG: carboxypeptidase M32 [Planctomycetota bacterium]|nr:MAG: carboxypeptidase M32 [Planctomycetota bacterium]
MEAMLDWDQETYLPKRGATERAGQLALLAGMIHERRTSDELAGMLSILEREDDDDYVVATNVREMRRTYDRAVKLPKELVEEIARTTTLAKGAWAEARRESAFSKFSPFLEKLLDLKRQAADHIGWNTEPYDALMDEYEPGALAADVERVFAAVRAEVVPLVAAIKDAPRQPDLDILKRPCPVDAQREFNYKIAAAIGFDFDAGRIDVSTHPFCTSTSPNNVRLTTRYDEHYMPMSLFGVMHEAGHGMYEQGLLVEHAGTPMGMAVSLGIHESQSRLWENQVGRSRPFWEHFFGALQQQFPSLADVSLDDWYFAINNVRPSLIRVEADEVTYGLHIMLRFDLERRMIRNELAVKDVPEAWNAGMQELLGITPPNDAEGCLQDIHWSIGTFGYFPTYQLGNLYAAQFVAKARADLPDLDDQFRQGRFDGLLDWLRKNIHQHGQRYRPTELVKVVTGRELSHEPYIAALKAKFEPLYGLA